MKQTRWFYLERHVYRSECFIYPKLLNGITLNLVSAFFAKTMLHKTDFNSVSFKRVHCKKNNTFWAITPCSTVKVYETFFRINYRLHLQCRRVSKKKKPRSKQGRFFDYENAGILPKRLWTSLKNTNSYYFFVWTLISPSKIYSLLHVVQTVLEVHTASCPMGTELISPG
jgi:hypothetical protein